MAAVVTTPKRKALANVRRGVLATPVRVLIYGAEKVGKSTFAAGAPKPIFLGAENGTERLNVERLEPRTWGEAVDWIDEIATEPHDFRTLVIDPANWFEPLAWAHLLGDSGQTIEQYGGGFGKGYVAALDLWRSMLYSIEKCWKRGMNVVITAHSQVKSFQNPEGPSFDRYELAMNPKAAAVLRQWVDAVLFTRLETFTKVEKDTKRAKGHSTGARIIHTQPSAAYDAGTRWKLPDEIPLGWDPFWEAVEAETHKADELLESVTKLTAELSDPGVTKFAASFVEKNRSNADKLAELVNRLNIKLDEKHLRETAK